jgi:Flp pilus assembly pilin Flp
MLKILSYFDQFTKEESGQAIYEYACIIAFVGVLMILVFAYSQGELSASLRQSCSSMVVQLEGLCSVAQGP